MFSSFFHQVGPVTHEDSSVSPNTDNHNRQQQQHYRLQLLAQAIEKIENEGSQSGNSVSTSPSISPEKQQQIPMDSLSMASTQHQQQELIMKLLTQQNIAAVMAAAAAAAQRQVQQQKLEPISPPSTSSASSSVESPIDFSSHRSTDDNNEGSTSSSPLPHQQQLLSAMLQNLQSSCSSTVSSPTTPTFPFLLTNKNGKPTRPFKAYPREPLMLPLGFCPTASNDQTNILLEAATRTTPNRKRLAQTQERLKQRLQQQQQQHQQQQPQSYFISSSGAQILQPPKKRHRTMETTMTDEENITAIPTTPTEVNSKSSLNSPSAVTNQEDPNAIKDDAYWERRRKNNEAAKRSRDARRAKEDEIAIR